MSSNISHWEFELEGELSDGEFNDKAAVMRAADEQWAESVQEYNTPRNGEVWEDTATLYAMDEDGEVISKEDYEVEYEHYHGDYAEHFHQGDYI